MKAFLLFFFLLSSLTTFCQTAPGIQWQKSYGGSKDENASSIKVTADGGYIIAGSSQSSNNDVVFNYGSDDFWIVKLNIAGNIAWQLVIGGSDFDKATSVTQTADGGYIVAGDSYSTDGYLSGAKKGYKALLVKISASGIIQWQKVIQPGFAAHVASIRQTADSGYVFTGAISSDIISNGTNNDCWVVKLTATGDIEWQAKNGGNSFEDVRFVSQTRDGGYIAAGITASTNLPGFHTSAGLSGDVYLLKLSAAGVTEWQKCLGSNSDDAAFTADTTLDGGYIVAGYTFGTNGDVSGKHGTGQTEDEWVVKLDSSGNIQWQKCLGGSLNEWATGVKEIKGGNGYLVTGVTSSNDGDVTGFHGGPDYPDEWVIKLTGEGNMVWQKCLGGTSNDMGVDIGDTPDGGVIALANSYSNDGDVTGGHGGQDFWVVKLAAEDKGHININASPSNAICAGTPVMFTAVSANGTYQWQKNHITVGTNSSTYKDSTLQNGDTVLCILTTADTVVTSNTIGITVTTPSVTIAGPGLLCAGNTATYKATAVLAGHPINYQWVKNNVNVGTNSNLYTDTHINDGDSIWCTIISDASCTAAAGLTSNKIVVKALAYGTVTATVTYNPYNYKLCAPGDTTTVTFHAVGQYGGANPSFQWVLNNAAAGTDTSFYTASGLKAGDKIYCLYTSSQKCVTGDIHTVTSNIVTITTKSTLTPAITIMQTPDTAICAGTKVRFKISSLSGGGENPIYQWMKNNVPVGTNSDVYYDSTLANNDSVWCKMTSHHPCLAGPGTVVSNKKKVKVDDALPTQPSAISGPSTVTANQGNINYSVTPQVNVTYLWSIPTDAGFVTDKHNSSVTVSWGGTAGNVVAQTRNGCGYSAKRVLAVHVSPSLVNAGKSEAAVIVTGKAALYPNPAKNFATLSFTATEAGTYAVQVVDANGRVLQVKETNAAKGRNTININVAGYAQGVYFVRLAGDNKQQSFKMLIQR